MTLGKIVLCLFVAIFAGCSHAPAINGNPCQAYLNEASHVEVTTSGQVSRMFGLRAGPSGEHEGFLMRLQNCARNRFTVRVEDNTGFAGEIPLGVGDAVSLKGEYEYYPRGGVIHWTHRDPRGRHPDGYIDFNGKRYQ